MKPERYQSLAGVLFFIGLLTWILLEPTDPVEASLIREAFWVIAGAVGGYGFGIDRARSKNTA